VKRWLGVALGWTLVMGCQRGGPAPSTAGGPLAPSLPRAGKEVRIAIITNAVAPFWDPMVVGMERAAQKLGCQASWQGPPNGKLAEQQRILENFVSQKVDAIAISPLEAETMGPVLREIQEKEGIIVITIDSDAPNSGRQAYIGTNNYKAGQVAGREAIRLLPQGGEVVAFVGHLSAQNARERLKGFEDAVAGHGIKVVEVKQDQTDKSKARRNVEDTLQAMPEVDLLLGLWSYNGPAIAQAVKDAGARQRIKILCFDAEPATLEYLKTGDIDATVVQKPYYFGYLAVELLYNMVVCGVEETLMLLPPDRIVDTGVEVVTSANVQEYLKKLEALGIKSS